MKNNIVAILLVLLVGAGAAAGWYFWQSKKDVTAEDLLAGNAVVYIRQDKAIDAVDQFLQSVYYKELRMINMPLLVEKFESDPKLIAVWEGFDRFLRDLSHDPAWRRFFGRELHLAVYPVMIESFDTKAASEVAKSLVVVLKPEKDAQLAEFLGRMLFQGSSEYPSEITEFQGHKIVSVGVPALALFNLKVHYAAVSDYFVVALDRSVVERSISLKESGGHTLAADPSFQKMKSKFIASAQSYLLLDLEFFVGKMKEIMRTADAPSEVERALEPMQGFKAFGYSASYGRPLTAKTDFYFDKDRMVDGLREIYSCTPKENKSARLIPKDVLLYQWSDCYDMTYYWSQFKRELGTAVNEQSPDSPAANPFEGMETFLEMDVEKEILPVLGKEQGWGIGNIDLGGQFPVPQVFLFIQVTDTAQAGRIMTKMTDEANILVQTEDYKGKAIKYIATPIGPIVPGYMLLDNYLILSSSRDFLKSVIDASGGAVPAITADPVYGDAKYGLTSPNNGVFIVRMSAVVEKLRGVVDWAVKWYSAKAGEMEAYRAGSEKRLSDLQEDIKFLEIDIAKLKTQLQNLQSQEAEAAGQGEAMATKLQEIRSKISQVRADLDLQEKNLSINRDKESELFMVVQEFEADRTLNAQLLPELVREGVYPVLRALASIEAIVAKIVFGEGIVESTGYIQIR